MTYNNPQHNTNKYSCTPFPILKEGDTSGIVTYLDLVDLGSISGFGVNLTEIGGTQRWDNTIITSWQTLFDAINEHLTIFNARLQELEQSANPDAITIISKSNNQLEANVDNVTWSSSSPKIIVNPTIGQTTTYSLASSATSYGSFTLTANRDLIEEGESITITAQWTGKTTTYDAIITATKSGMTSATKSVQLPKEAICHTSVTLDNGKTITLNSSSYGTLTYTPSVGSYTIRTQGNETPGSCSFTVAAAQPTTTYYWYVGTTLPTAANLLSIATGSATSKPNWSTPYSIAATNNTGESSYMYYCFPAEWNVMVLDSDRSTEVALAPEGTITVNNITYNIQRTGRKISNGTSKDYYAIFNNGEAITITSKSNNKLEADVDNVNWSSDSSYIDVSPKTGQTTTYSLTSSATSYGSFTLTTNKSSIQEGESITITAQWYGNTIPYSATITATKAGMKSATKSVTLSKEATRPTYVDLDNGETITLNSNGYGTYTYTPSVGNYTVTTQGNETSGSCSFAVNEVTPIIEPVNADIVAIYNIQDTSSPTTICNNGSSFKAMEIDGVVQPSVVASYKFNTTGTHTIKYELNDSVIGDWAFADCSSLTSVDILDSVTSIGNGVFYRCSCLTSVTIGNGVTNINTSAFWSCSGLTSITIPNNVTYIGGNAFANCKGLTNVTINNGVIGDYEFIGCSGLTSVDIPDSVTSIGDGAFNNCSGLTSVTLPNRLTEIGLYAFQDCSGLTSIDIPSSVTSIADGAFSNCTSLTSITSNRMTAPKISNTTFQDVKIGGTLTVSYYSSDYDDTWLSKSTYYLGYYDWNIEYYDEPETITITSKSGNQLEADVDNVNWSSDSSYIDVNPKTGQTTTYSLTSSATSYGSFTLNTDKSSIEEGESITITAQWYNHTTPYSATITATKSGMTSAAKQVTLYKEATRPTYVDLDNGARITLNSSGRGTYTYTPTVGNYTITTQGNETPGSCSFTVNEVTPIIEPVNADIVAVYNIQDTSKSTKLLDSGSSFKAMEIDGVAQPSVVTSYKFNTTGPHTIKYELNGSGIGQSAFCICSNLTSVTINNGVTSIGSSAFKDCSSLTSIDIPDGVTSIDDSVFEYCSGLTSIDIPDSVTSIGNYAFYGCSGLTNIDIPDSVTSIDDSVFEYCSGLTSVTIGNSVTSIGNGAFSGCSSLTSIDIPDNVTSIGNSAFSDCTSLTSVTIPDSVKRIGGDAFSDCTSLTSITSYAMTPPDISNYTFQNVKTGGTLTVPYGSSGYDTWLSTGNYYLGKYSWNIEYDGEPETITITSKSGNQLEANVDNVNWRSDSSYINVSPETGQTTTYSLANSATPHGSFTLTTNKSSIEEGESITITAQWTGGSSRYSTTITASKPGMGSAAKLVTLYKEATRPTYVDLDNGARITLNSSGYGTYTYTPTVGNYTVTTQGNETPGSCSFTVAEATPDDIIITSKSGNQLEANVDNVSWSSDNSYIDVSPKTGQTTTYFLTDSATSYGSFILTTDSDLIEEGESITITAQWYNNTTPYSATITATKSGMRSATKQVTLSKDATCPVYVRLDNGETITLNTSSGRGTCTYTPVGIGSYTIKTQGNETQGSCSFTVNEVTPIIEPVNADLIAYYNVQNISSPTAICINNGNSFKAMEIDGVDSVNITTQGEIKYQFNTTGSHTIKYELNDSSIGAGAFSGNIGSLTSIDILDSVTSIGGGAFSGRSSLTSIDIPDSVTSIGGGAFAGCSGLTSIDIPASVTSIGTNAFSSCSSLTSITSNAMTPPTISNNTFQGVKTGGTLTVPYGSNGYYGWLSSDSYYLGYYNWTIKYYGVPNVEPINEDIVAYYNIQDTSSPTTICVNNGNKFKAMEIDGVVQPNVVESYQFNTTGQHTIKYELNDSNIAFKNIANGAFSACTSLTSCTIADSVTSIGMGAFAGCNSLTSIDIPDSVTSIGTNAFSGCSSLTSIVCNAMTAPKISSSTFASIATDGTLTRPAGSTGYDVWLGEGNYYLGKYGWHAKLM